MKLTMGLVVVVVVEATIFIRTLQHLPLSSGLIVFCVSVWTRLSKFFLKWSYAIWAKFYKLKNVSILQEKLFCGHTKDLSGPDLTFGPYFLPPLSRKLFTTLPEAEHWTIITIMLKFYMLRLLAGTADPFVLKQSLACYIYHTSKYDF